jgi:chemotaxis protein methyltransferase CheR
MTDQLTLREFELFKSLIYQWTGINLSESKRSMLRSRLAKRVRALELDSFTAYYELITKPGVPESELTAFVNCVTTNKTGFYREPHHFEFVTNRVIPEIQKGQLGERGQLRVWHAGCSTGEEAYTLSIELHEKLFGNWTIRQLATDIDTNVLQHGKDGLYDTDVLGPIPDGLTKKYFLRGTGQNAGLAKVKPALGEWLTWQRLNLLDERWPFKAETQFDVIFCRNVMIYFDKPTQARLVKRFHQMLTPGGYLIVGHSESLLNISEDLRCLGGTVYKEVASLREAA